MLDFNYDDPIFIFMTIFTLYYDHPLVKCFFMVTEKWRLFEIHVIIAFVKGGRDLDEIIVNLLDDSIPPDL